MPSPDLLDFAALIAPIPGDDPAGSDTGFYATRDTLNECRTSHDPSQYQPGSPERQQEKRDPNWSKIIQETKSQLTGKCKHIFYAVRLAEALVVQHGLLGVRDGLKLLRLFITDCWDRSYWKIDEDGPDKGKVDATRQIAEINGLGYPMSGVMYPTKIRKAPVFGAVSWQDWKDATGDFESAAAAVTANQLQVLIEDIETAIQESRDLQTLTEQRGADEPAELGEVTRALTDCLTLAKQALLKKGGPIADDAAAVGGDAATAGAGAAQVVVMDPTAQRNAIYEQIIQLADKLEKIDSHSPVPQLLRKVRTLADMKFHDLVKKLTKSDNVLEFMKPDGED